MTHGISKKNSVETIDAVTPQIKKKTSVGMIDAVYKETGSTRYDGNPLIEALPQLPPNRSGFDYWMEYLPPKPTEKMRKMSEVSRLMELMTLTDLVYSFPEY